MKRLLVVLTVVAVALLVLWPTPVRGENPTPTLTTESTITNNHAVVGLWNNTSRAINYQFRWGENEWKQWTIEPGQRRWHAWTFATPNQDHWPSPMIRFDSDGRGGVVTFVTRALEANPAPERDYWYGIRYSFWLDDNGYTIHLSRVYDDPVRRE